MDGLGMCKLESFIGCLNGGNSCFCSVLTRFRPDESQMSLQGGAILSSKNMYFYFS
jgi:hypothetical protein